MNTSNTSATINRCHWIVAAILAALAYGRRLFLSAHLQRPDNGEPDIAFADAIVAKSIRRGMLFFVTGRGFIKFSPPLCIEPDTAIEAAEVIRDCFFALAKPDRMNRPGYQGIP